MKKLAPIFWLTAALLGANPAWADRHEICDEFHFSVLGEGDPLAPATICADATSVYVLNATLNIPAAFVSGSVSFPVSIAQQETNAQPQPVALSPLITPPNQPLTVALPATDSNGDTLSYSALLTDGGIADINGNLFTFTPETDLIGYGGAFIVATDGFGYAVTAANITMVLPVDARPTFTERAYTVPSGQSVTFTLETDAIATDQIVSPLFGTLDDLGGGTYKYTAHATILNNDSVGFRVRNANGPTYGVIRFQIIPAITQSNISLNGVPAGSVPGQYGPGSFLLDTTQFSDGVYTISFDVGSAAGQIASSQSTITIDNTAPDVCSYIYPTPPADNVVRNTITLRVAAHDALSGIGGVDHDFPARMPRAYVPDADASGEWVKDPFDTRLDADNMYAVKAVCYDRAGNFAEATRSLRFDNTKPSLSLTLTPAPDTLINGMKTVNGAATDTGSGVTVLMLGVDGVSVASVNSATLVYPFNTTAFSDGAHALELTATDAIGNIDSVGKSVTVDNTPPTILITDPVNGAALPSLSQVQTTVTDLHPGSVEILVDGIVVPVTVAASLYTLSTPLTDAGVHKMTVRATDAAGNIATMSRTVVITTGDGPPVQPPNVQFITPQNGDAVGGVIDVKVLITGSLLTKVPSIQINGIAAQPLTPLGSGLFDFSFDTTQVPAGSATLDVIAENDLGPGTAAITVLIDNTPPRVLSFVPPNGGTVSGQIVIQGSGVDDQDPNANSGVASVEIIIDGTVVASVIGGGPLAYSWNSSGGPDGMHTITLRIVDGGGNITEKTNVVTVKNSGGGSLPVITVIKPTDDHVFGAVVSAFHWTTDVPVLSATYSIDGGAPVNATEISPQTFRDSFNATSLTDGFHIVRFTAANAAGSVFKTVRFRIDTQSPAVSIAKPTANQVLFLAQTLLVNASDSSGVPLASVRFLIDTTVELAYFPGNPNVNETLYSYLLNTEATDANGSRRFADPGDHLLTVIAEDAAGNKTQSSVGFRIDNNANVPIDEAAVVEWTPSEAFVSGSGPTLVSAKILNATVDAASVNSNTLQIFLDMDGLKHQRLDGNVQLSGNTLQFLTPIPPNARVSCALTAVTTEGKAIRQTHEFINPMRAATGGTAKLGNFSISIPAEGLTENALVEVGQPSDDDPEAKESKQASQSDLETHAEVIFGPVRISALTAAGDKLSKLKYPAQIIYKRDVAPNKDIGFVDRIHLFDRRWRPLGADDNAASSGGETPGSRTLNAQVLVFGIYRIVSVELPSNGISGFFNYPNPFSPFESGTTFQYLLGKNSAAHLVIYDLLGNLVRQFEFGGGTEGGQTAQNTVVWDGKNGEGRAVANGGYIAVLSVTAEDGSKFRAIRKVAVAK